ncbi:MAG: alpha/beta hydrolase fold domain-containing protein, partial [Shewanella sp.]
MAFIVDYALAPENPFPAAFHDALSVYNTLVSQGFSNIALVGDSAGGGLTLALSGDLSTAQGIKLTAAVAISPWVDMTASGLSYQTRSESDPFLNKHKLLEAASLYLREADPRDPRASALFGDFNSLPPTLIHVGHDEVLLDDAIRYTEIAEKSGSNV